MSQRMPVKGASFWKDSYPAIKEMLRLEWRLIFGFAAFCVIYKIIIAFAMDEFRPSPSPLNIYFKTYYIDHLSYIVDAIGYYVFTTAYLQKKAKAAPPKLSTKDFFCWLHNVCLKWLLLSPLFVPILFISSPFGILMLTFSTDSGSLLVVKSAYAFCGLLYCALFYFAIRLSLVSPLAILQNKSAVKNSWQLTKKKFWRISGKYLIVIFVWLVVSSLPALPFYLMPKLPLTDKIVIGILWNSLLESLFLMTSAVYFCTVYRVLIKERKAADSLSIPVFPAAN